MQGIPGSDNWLKMEPLDGGLSKDEKFRIITRDGTCLLLELADSRAFETKHREFEFLQLLNSRDGLPVPCPVGCGLCENGASCFLLMTWMPGENARDKAQFLPPEKLYSLGVQAGGILHAFHQAGILHPERPCGPDLKKQLQRKLQMYNDSGLEFPDDSLIIEFLMDNAPCVLQEPLSLLHGDFHLGNLVLDDLNRLSVIDFNRVKPGPPIQDFSRMAVFSRMTSTDFCQGQIAGYLQGAAPDSAFWDKLAYFAIFEGFFNLLWVLPYGDDQMQLARKHLKLLLKDFNYLQSTIPRWAVSRN